MSEFARPTQQLIRILTNRYVITVLLITISILIWKVHVQANDDGYIKGAVVDEYGTGIAGATVLLQERDLVIVEAPMSTRTDENGQFTFEEMSLVSFFIWAQKDGYITAEKSPYHLYFMEQNFTLPEPLILIQE